MIQSSFLFANITKVSVLRRFCFDQSKIDKPGGCNKNVLLCIFQKKKQLRKGTGIPYFRVAISWKAFNQNLVWQKPITRQKVSRWIQQDSK